MSNMLQSNKEYKKHLSVLFLLASVSLCTRCTWFCCSGFLGFCG